jgi:hypothetical protein
MARGKGLPGAAKKSFAQELVVPLPMRDWLRATKRALLGHAMGANPDLRQGTGAEIPVGLQTASFHLAATDRTAASHETRPSAASSRPKGRAART